MGGEGKKESIHAISNHGIITATMTSKVYDEREKKFEKKREAENNFKTEKRDNRLTLG